MEITAVNLNIGETVKINTDEWDDDVKFGLYGDSKEYLIVLHNGWKYKVHADDIEAYFYIQLMLDRAIGC